MIFRRFTSKTSLKTVWKKKIKRALISVYHKDKLDEIIKNFLQRCHLLSTGGTKSFIDRLEFPAIQWKI